MKPMKRFLAFTLSLSMLMSGAAALAETDTEACTIPDRRLRPKALLPKLQPNEMRGAKTAAVVAARLKLPR